MKKITILFLILVVVFKANAQINEISQIEYSKDSIPVFVKFNTKANNNQSDAIAVIKKYLELSNDDDLKTKKYFTDDLGFIHERFQHYFKGIKVEFSEYNVHIKNGKIQSINGNLTPVRFIDVNPALTENEALKLALNYDHR